MYKKLFATLLVFMLMGLNSICLESFGHVMADSAHVDHEHTAEVACANCDEQNHSSNMTCCIDASERKVNFDTDNRLLSDSSPSVVLPHVAIFDLAAANSKERTYLALAPNPPLILVGTVVKKE